ncbi:MAG: three-Cys-motif partner protein TcmP [Chloroflexi bacterium]|nr:three-Cys-motif partner protein TcmP [Chloroflexota bacterium]
MPQHDDFFNTELDEESRIKLGTLSWFLAPWTQKLGSWARQNGQNTVWYVDGFAGPGKNEAGERGSPLIAATRAEQLVRHGNPSEFELALFNVEKIPGNFEKLEVNCKPFIDGGTRIINGKGLFADHVSEIVGLTDGPPVLLFIDPWGFTGFEFDTLVPLFARSAPLDIVMRLHHRAIPRLKPERAAMVSATVGSDHWQANWADLNMDQKVHQTLDTLKDSYTARGRFSSVLFYPVRLHPQAKPAYSLGFASRHIEAFRLWNDKIGGIESEIHERADHPDSGQQAMELTGLSDTRFNTIRDEVTKYFERHRGNTWQNAYDWLIFNSSTFVRETELTNTIDQLVNIGVVRRVGGPGRGTRKGMFSAVKNSV